MLCLLSITFTFTPQIEGPQVPHHIQKKNEKRAWTEEGIALYIYLYYMTEKATEYVHSIRLQSFTFYQLKTRGTQKGHLHLVEFKLLIRIAISIVNSRSSSSPAKP
jgi:hypothetical protein